MNLNILLSCVEFFNSIYNLSRNLFAVHWNEISSLYSNFCDICTSVFLFFHTIILLLISHHYSKLFYAVLHSSILVANGIILAQFPYIFYISIRTSFMEHSHLQLLSTMKMKMRMFFEASLNI